MSVDEELKTRVEAANYMWRNRRRMAWLSFVSILAVTGLCFFWVDIERLEKLETVITWFYMAMASIVGAYMGFSTYASVKGMDVYQGEIGSQFPGEDSRATPDVPEDEVKPRRRKSERRVPLSLE